MRQGQGSKRSRGRGGGRRNTPQRHQNFDSNGPSIRIRGNANQVYEKYLQLARDANTAGDRVAAENMFQHAEHYFRVLNVEERENLQARSQNRGNGEDGHAAPAPQPSRGNGAEHRHAPRQPSNEAQPPSGSEPESGAKAEQPLGRQDDAELPGGDAPGGEDLSPGRPQRRTRRGNGRATPPNRDTVDTEASESPELTEDVTETPAAD